jgi:hypothetical protein
VRHVYRVIETPFSAFLVNMAAVSDKHGETSIRAFAKWNRGTMGNGVEICWLNAAGVS